MRKYEYTGFFLIVIFSGVVFLLAFLLIYNLTKHDRRMELIKEKEALIHLQNWVKIKQNQHWIDSMHNEINKDLK